LEMDSARLTSIAELSLGALNEGSASELFEFRELLSCLIEDADLVIGRRESKLEELRNG
jgi:hypothetical protein